MKPPLVLAVIGLALTGLVGYHGIHGRQQERVQLIQAQIAQEQANRQVQQDVAALLDQVEQYRKRLPSEPEPSWLVREAVALGRKAGLELATITQESPQQFQQFTRLAISLEFKASYHALGTFLDYIEQSDAFIRAERLVLSKPGDEDGVTSVSLVLSTIHLPPVAGIAG